MDNAGRKAVAGINSIINFIVIVFLVLLLLIGCYVLWETKLVHTEASKNTWKSYKPKDIPTYSFDELKAINSDVVGWVDVYGTGIDYPVLYHPDTSHYLFKDAFGKSSVIGSIFMDGGCSKDFSDFQTIIYGHHMESHCMLGDITNFIAKKYFDEHEYGDLFYNNVHHGLKILGIVNGYASDPWLYKVKVPRYLASSYLSPIKSASKNWRDGAIDLSKDKILLLSTCSDSSDTRRTVLIAAITDQTYENPFAEEPNFGLGADDLKGWLGFPWIAWFAGLVVVVMVTIYILWQINRTNEKKKLERMVFNNDKL